MVLIVVVIAWVAVLLTPIWTLPVSRDTTLIAITLILCTGGLTNVLRDLFRDPSTK